MILTLDYSRVAATWNRVQMILRGLDDDVDTFGIMTAWNPIARKPTGPNRRLNRIDNTELLQDLRSFGLGPIKVVGNFRNIPEGSLLIPNVGREYMVELCGMYDQESVFYAEKIEDEEGNPGIRYHLLRSDGQDDAPPETIMNFSGDPGVDTEETNFSAYGGDRPKEDRPGQKAPSRKRFVVPFKFEEENEGKKEE